MIMKTTKSPRMHWLSPTLMLSSLVLGLLLSVGHHLFYQSLDGQHTTKTSHSFFGSSYSNQQLNIAVGTTFAFLVRSALVLSVSTAFCQAFWKEVQRLSLDNSVTTIDRIDTIYAAPTNIVAFFTASAWIHYPALFLTALIIW
jgi:hypothetical protein